MDTRSTAGPSAYPHQRRLVMQKASPDSPTVDQAITGLGTQTAGLDQSLVGAVNASRIAALSGPQTATPIDRAARPSDDIAGVYRRSQMVVTPAASARLAS